MYHYVCERLSVMNKQVSGWTVNFVQILQKAISWYFDYFQFWHPTPPPPLENWNLAISWHFEYFQFGTLTPPPPPTSWNLAISWHFEYFQFWHPIPPPPTRKACNPGDRMRRLIRIPRGYHLFRTVFGKSASSPGVTFFWLSNPLLVTIFPQYRKDIYYYKPCSTFVIRLLWYFSCSSSLLLSL